MEPVKRDMELLSNSMATYAHIKGKTLSISITAVAKLELRTPFKVHTSNIRGHKNDYQ